MKYRVRLDLILDNDKLALANTIYNQLFTQLKDNARVITLTDEKSFLELEECHHDESPPQPCQILERIEKE